MLAAVPTFVKTDLAKPIYLAFSYDEEVGCISGRLLAEAIRDHYPENPGACIVGEPSRMEPVTGHKGIMVYKVTVRGSAGHSSRIRTEVSAVHEASRIVLWIEGKMDELVAEGFSDERFDPPHTSLHVGMIRGGTAHNIVADSCWFTLDVRCLPSDDLAAIEADFRAFAKTQEAAMQRRFAGASITIEEYHPNVPPLITEESSEAVALIRAITGVEALRTVAYASEGGQFSAAGFDTVICGPGDIAQAHRADEFVEIAQLHRCVEVLEKLAR